MIVLLLLCPSGLWMARYAQTGPVAAVGFSVLAIVTGICVLLGWRYAVKRDFAEHRLWMSRCFLLLCSAVVLRLIGGLVTLTSIGVAWSYPTAAWVSWLAPLIAYELTRAIKRQRIRRAVRIKAAYSPPSAAGVSLPSMEISARRVPAGVSSIRN
jgi:uncharacterized membrane protein YdjX (TVP38/TMEM64 family)